MSPWLIGVIAAAHAAISVEQLTLGHGGMALVFVGYALAGAGLLLVVR